MVGIAWLAARRPESHSRWTRMVRPEPITGNHVRRPELPVGAALLVLGLTDVSGLIAFSLGLELAPAWLLGLVASFGPAVAIGVGVVWLSERPLRTQWIGPG
jgi:drug/metabolite transporter (DMT)-like permease